MLSNKFMLGALSIGGRISSRSIGVAARLLNSDTPKIEKTVNQVSLLGRVGNDPQQRGNDQHPAVTFSLATHNSYRYESGDMLQRTDWHRITIFKPHLRDLVLNYLKKGQRVYLQGRLTYGEVRTADGQVRTSSSIIADDIIFLQKNEQKSVVEEQERV